MKYSLFLWLLPFLMTMQTEDSVKIKQSIDKELLDLHYLVREPPSNVSQAPVLILLHGYGSNENDLFSLASQIPENWLVVAVRAPFALGSNQYKWYDVKLVNEKITMNFEDEEHSRKALLQLIDQLVLKYKVDKKKIITAGFSQGANMALGLALTAPQIVLAAGCFSGRFMEEIKPLIQNKAALKTKQVFLSHGTEDNMLPLRYVEENKAILEELGIEVTLCTDKVAHTISPKQLNEFVGWLNSL